MLTNISTLALMPKLYFSLTLWSFLILTAVPSASAEMTANVDIQRYGARNLSKQESIYSQDIKAIEGNELEFSLNIKNNSSLQASGAVLYVYLPIGFPLDSNSIYVDGTRTGGNISNGLFLGNINASSQKEIVFKTKINGYFNGYTAIQALAIGDNFNSSSKYVAVTKNGPDAETAVASLIPSPTPWPTLTPATSVQNNILGVSVLGKNLTKQDANWQKTVKAEPEDLLQFSIMLTANRGIAAKNVYVKNNLDGFLDFISGSVTINNSSASNSLIHDRLFIDNVASQEAKFIKFQVRVQNASQLGKDVIILSNTVQVWAENNILISDASSVSVANKQTKEKMPTVAATITPTKSAGSGNNVVPTKTAELVIQKEAGAAQKNSFLSGIIGFSHFGLLLILILLALVILLATFLAQERKKNREKTVAF